MSKMAKIILFIIGVTICMSLATADWNILNQRRRRNSNSNNDNLLKESALKRYCESWRMNVELDNIREFKVVPEECISNIKKYMTSSQYEADSQRTVEEVRVYLSSCCHLQNDGRDAWIFDVDDTLLSTIPFYKKHNFGGEKFNKTLLEEWMQGSKAPALEHTLKLFHEIKDSGVKIFLVSSRSETLRSATVDNLIHAGYHSWTSLTLRGLEDENTNLQEYKSKARKKLIEEGYRIWGIIGDQWSSIKGLPAAKRTFKLPNSMYYLA